MNRIGLPKWERNPVKEADDRPTLSSRDGLQRDSTGFGSMKTFVSKQDRLGTFNLCESRGAPLTFLYAPAGPEPWLDESCLNGPPRALPCPRPCWKSRSRSSAVSSGRTSVSPCACSVGTLSPQARSSAPRPD